MSVSHDGCCEGCPLRVLCDQADRAPKTLRKATSEARVDVNRLKRKTEDSSLEAGRRAQTPRPVHRLGR